ncbi:MAG: hypothetical protein FWB96_03435 [Defluviitaleaceae bacterium]|nr:hypothetical protein [Defluviitaleaceae bacterium]MCL2261732.1 hypothetical protein [Defluviitaleaceae bacterium]
MNIFSISAEKANYVPQKINATATNIQGKSEPSFSTSNAEKPQEEVHRPDTNPARCRSYRLFLGRGTPELIFSKTIDRLAKIHDKLGLDWQPPDFINGRTEFEPYMELDKLFDTFTFNKPLVQLFTNGIQMFTSDFVGSRLVLNCTFSQMDASAYRLAAMLADARSRLDTEGLAEKLEAANLPEGIDMELLLETLSHLATEGLKKAEEFVESRIQSEAKIFAKRKFNILVDYDSRDTNSKEFLAKFEPFKKTVEQLLRENIELAGNIIGEMGIGKFTEFFSINIVPARIFNALQVENFLKELPPLDSPVTLNLSGKEFTRGELEQRIDQIKRIESRR